MASSRDEEKPAYTRGVAPIKKEFLIDKPWNGASVPDDDAAESAHRRPVARDEKPSSDTAPASGVTTAGDGTREGDSVGLKAGLQHSRPSSPAASGDEGEPASKKVKLSGAQRKKLAKEAAWQKNKEGKKQKRGQNKGRKFARVSDDVPFCFSLARTGECQKLKEGQRCDRSHDIMAYMAAKPADVHFAPASATSYSLEPPFVPWTHKSDSAEEETEPSATGDARDVVLSKLDFSTRCPNFDRFGECPQGLRCRFLGAHVRVVEPSAKTEEMAAAADGPVERKEKVVEIVVDEERVRARKAEGKWGLDEDNILDKGFIIRVRKKQYKFPRAEAVLAELAAQEGASTKSGGATCEAVSAEDGQPSMPGEAVEPVKVEEEHADGGGDKEKARKEEALTDVFPAEAGAPDAKIRPAEKKRLNWRGKLYLAPLTTTGNLPFRRVCSTFGSDIHCGEMGLARSFATGNASEWSLVRRWEGEKIFGVQVCGSTPRDLLPAAEVISNECNVDFVDVNCGCPIDLVFKQGAGSALMAHQNKLGKILTNMNKVLGEVPLTIKMRTGVNTGKNVAHKLFPRLQEWGVSAATIHGRSRQQRYKLNADWNYISECVRALRESVQSQGEDNPDEAELPTIPIFGNGDIYGWQDYEHQMATTGVDGTMIARGALIKPWIFTEIKERRDWDISSRERLDIIRQYAEYGLNHWGSDTYGINTTRRYLCEALSFWYRYVPVGLLEHLPARMNDRPPPYRGRDELETLLSSSNSADWVKISEMFLGKCPESWTFQPKHKSNAYPDAVEEAEEAEG